MTIKNLSSEFKSKIHYLIEEENFKVYKKFKTESESIQSNYDMGMLITSELMMQQSDLLNEYKKELISITNN
jgi:hypothetical protein